MFNQSGIKKLSPKVRCAAASYFKDREFACFPMAQSGDWPLRFIQELAVWHAHAILVRPFGMVPGSSEPGRPHASAAFC